MDNVEYLHRFRDLREPPKRPAERIALDRPLSLGLPDDFVLSADPEPQTARDALREEAPALPARLLARLSGLLTALSYRIRRRVFMTQLGRLAALIARLNDRERFCVFLDVAGHVETYQVRIYSRGWVSKTSPCYTLDGRFPRPDRPGNALREIRATMRLIRNLSAAAKDMQHSRAHSR
ncbi:MAG: hypothetical protein RIC85_00500 [Gammaproteobacteria bacterium]